MIPLLIKDFKMLIPTLLVVLGYFPLAYLINISPGFAYYLMILGILLNLFYYDSSSKMNQTIVSMPVSRKSMVLARYLFLLLTAVFFFVYLMIIDMIMRNILPYYSYPPMSKWTILTYLCGVLILMALSLPYYYKLSFLKAIVFQIFSVTLLIGLMSLVSIGTSITDITWLKNLGSNLMDFFLQYPFMNTIVITLLISLLSYLLSTKFFNNKNLSL